MNHVVVKWEQTKFQFRINCLQPPAENFVKFKITENLFPSQKITVIVPLLQILPAFIKFISSTEDSRDVII